MNKEKLRMSFLAGLITEGEYKQKLGENEDKDFIKSEMERLISKVSNNSEIPEEEKMERIDNIKFVIYDFLDPETRGGKRPPIGFKFDDKWWSSVKSLDPIVYQDALSELLSAARGSDSFNMDEKQDLNENVVGIGAINNPFPTREKSDYELAFEHFTRGEVNEENLEFDQFEEDEFNEEMGDDIDTGSKYEGVDMHDNIKFYGFVNISNFKNEKTYRIEANTPKALIKLLNRSYRELIQRSAQDQYSVTELLEDLATNPIYAVYDDYAYVTTSKEKFNEWLPKFPQAISSARYGTDMSSPGGGIGMATDI